MREIKFRGKALRDSQWINGSLIQASGEAFIFGEGIYLPSEKIGRMLTEVDPKTVGQYLELDDDKDNTSIYDGDILKVTGQSQYSNNYFSTDDEWEMTMVVIYTTSAFLLQELDDRFIQILILEVMGSDMELEVIGNIYDNPELLEVKP